MKLEGLHHITMITGDANATVAYYADTLGLRLVKKTVNFDQPDAYHLYFGDETGAPGSILTWFEFPGAAPGSAGIGDIHTLQLGVASAASLDFWAARLEGAERDGDVLRFADPDGLALELVAGVNPPLRAVHPEIPAEHAITGLEGARAYGGFANVEERLLTGTLGFTWLGDGEYRLDGAERSFRWAYDAPVAHGRQGAGTVHHIAWASRDADHEAWQARVSDAGGLVTDVRDRDYFRSIYFREPRGVLFEIATLSPGFAAGDPAGLLVLHHGRGADEHDLLGLGDVLDPERRLHVVTPRAPLTLPGWPGFHWYVVPRVGYPDHDTFHAAYAALAELHDELWERTGIGPERTVLGGFSMGSVMSYSLGLGADRPAPAGIMAFSGFIPVVDGWTPDLAGRASTPVFIAHGRNDPVMEIGFARRARDLLEEAGLPVSYHESDAAHHIDPAHIPAAVDWLPL